MTEDYCTFEEVEREKRGGKREVELHLSFTLSGDFIRPVDERASSAQRKSRADTKRCFWELTPERERAFIPLMSNEVDLPGPNKIKRIIFKTTK